LGRTAAQPLDEPTPDDEAGDLLEPLDEVLREEDLAQAPGLLWTSGGDLGQAPLAGGEGLALSPHLRLLGLVRLGAFAVRRDLAAGRAEDLELGLDLGVALRYARDRSLLRLDYGFSQRRFVRRSLPDASEHRVQLRALRTSQRVSLQLSAFAGELTRSEDPRFLGARARRYLLGSSLQLGWRFTAALEWLAEGSFEWEDQRTRAFEALDRREWSGASFLGWRLLPGLRALAGVGFRRLVLPSPDAVGADLDLYSFQIGGVLRLRRFELRARVGYEFPHAREAGVPDPEPTTALDVRLDVRLRPGSSVRLSAARRFEASALAVSQVTTRVALELGHELRAGLELFARIAYQQLKPSEGRGLRGLRGVLGLGWSPLAGVRLTAQGEAELRRGREELDAEVYRVGIGLSISP